MSPVNEIEFETMKRQISALQSRLAILESVLKVERGGDVSLTSTTKVLIKGVTVDITSDSILNIKGTVVNIN